MRLTRGPAIVARARALIGARFRAQGRDPDWGLDCVGVAVHALGLSGVRSDYALRGGSLETLQGELRRAGLARVDGPRPGDLLLMRAGPAQLHLGILTDSGLVHADAGLRRVVERPGPPPFETLSAWRPGEAEEC